MQQLKPEDIQVESYATSDEDSSRPAWVDCPTCPKTSCPETCPM